MFSGSATAQVLTVSEDEELGADGNPYHGIVVDSGARLDGTYLVIEQSPQNAGVQVKQGEANLTGGSITQAGTGKYVVGLGVFGNGAEGQGTITASDVTIAISGGKDAGGLYVFGDEARIVGDNLDITIEAIGSSTAEPAAAVKVRKGIVETSNSTFSSSGDVVFGLLASGNKVDSTVLSTNDDITTNGERAFGAFAFADSGDIGHGTIQIDGGSITTTGAGAYGVVSQGGNAQITAGNGFAISTTGDEAHGAYAVLGSSIDLTDVTIATDGIHAYGAYATDGSTITLTGGEVRTLDETGRGSQDGDGSRGYALYAKGAGSSVTATGTQIQTLGQRAYGAYATDGGVVTLNAVSISTEGFMAYGVYASGDGSVVTANDVNVTTTGQVGDAAWAYQGGTLNLNGGTYTVRGEPMPNEPFEAANGLLAVGGTETEAGGVINADGITVLTEGANSSGILVGHPIGSALTSGQVNLKNSSVTVQGAQAQAAGVNYGSSLNVENSTLVSQQGAGVVMTDDATVSLVGTTVESAEESLRAKFSQAGQVQVITIGADSVLTQNNGTLLLVQRSGDGTDGIVDLTLGAGSTSSGDIIDEGERTGAGGTDVTLAEGASWTGTLRGVRNFTGGAGSEITYEDHVEIAGNVAGDGTSYNFAAAGASIGGDVTLNNGSSTTGGSTDTPIEVAGSVTVDQSSTMGGNWSIAGNLSSAGTLAPGNSIGTVEVGGDLILAPTFVYEMEIDASGAADHSNVAGTATLAGSVNVEPLDGFLVGQPYTILTAGTRVNEFQSVNFSEDYIFLQADLTYDPNTVYLMINRSDVAFASVAQTGNQMATATALDSLPLASELASAVALSRADEAADAFDQLSGEIHASVGTGLIEESHHLRDTINGRLAAPSSLARTEADSGNGGFGIWASGFGSWGKSDPVTNAAKLDRDVAGGFIGVDGSIGAVRLGVLGGYSRSNYDVDARSSTGDVDSYHLGIYGSAALGGINLRAGAAHSWHNVETARTITFSGFAGSASAKYDATTTQLFGELGYGVSLGTSTIEPFAGLAYVDLDTDDFTESGGAVALASPGGKNDATFSTLGVRASTELGLGGLPVTANGLFGWRHAFGDRQPVASLAFAGSDNFAVSGVPISDDAAIVEVGLDARIAPGARIELSYIGQHGGSTSENGMRGSVSFRF